MEIVETAETVKTVETVETVRDCRDCRDSRDGGTVGRWDGGNKTLPTLGMRSSPSPHLQAVLAAGCWLVCCLLICLLQGSRLCGLRN